MKHTSNCRGIESFILLMNWFISIKALILNTIPLSINISGGECLEGREWRRTDEKIDIDLLCLFTKPVNTETSGGQLELYIILSSAPEGLPLNKCLHCSEFVNRGNNNINCFTKSLFWDYFFFPLKTKQWTEKPNLFLYSQFLSSGRLALSSGPFTTSSFTTQCLYCMPCCKSKMEGTASLQGLCIALPCYGKSTAPLQGQFSCLLNTMLYLHEHILLTFLSIAMWVPDLIFIACVTKDTVPLWVIFTSWVIRYINI